jgi:hypothetical protein
MGARSTGRNVGRRRDRTSAPDPSNTTSSARLFAESFWLARKEIKWAWPSNVMTVLVVLFLGLGAALSLSVGSPESEGFVLREHETEHFYSVFFADYLFLLVCAVLGANTIPRYYTQNWRGTFSSRLAFLRGLPIPAVALVGSRMISMLLALFLGALAFFLPIFFLSGLGEKLGIEAYVFFCAVWIGYGLLGSGLCLFFEFGVSGRVYAIVSYCFAISLLIAVALLELTRYAGLVGRIAWLVQGSHGALLINFSILTGAAAFVLLSIATVHRLQNGDPPR